MRIRQLLGLTVMGSSGWTIGKVRDLVFDEHSWKVGALRIQLARPVAEEYRMKHLLTRTTIEVGTESIHAIGDHVVLSVTKADLRRLVGGDRPPTPRGGPPSP